MKVIVIDDEYNICDVKRCSCADQLIDDIQTDDQNRIIHCDNKEELLQEIDCYLLQMEGV